MRTAPPHRNNAFGPDSRLVRRPRNLHLLSELPADLPTKLFARAKLVRLAAGKILCRAGAPGDGCYRVEGRTPQGCDGFEFRRRAHP